jgi:hypothetical protein
MAAIQLAPVALNVAEGIGSGVVHVAESVVIGAHNSSKKNPEDLHPGEDEVDRRDRCDRLAVQAPGVIELRTDASGAPEYRELTLFVAFDQSDWRPVIEEGTDPDGWRPALHFLQMNFAPPLDANLPKQGSDYLAYALAEPKSAEEEDRLTNLTTNFSPSTGTFTWNERAYQYATAGTLPCFAAPAKP